MKTKNKIKQSRRGFASMSEAKRRRIARKGGKTAHAMGKAHQFTSKEAKVAGRKGGMAKAEALRMKVKK